MQFGISERRSSAPELRSAVYPRSSPYHGGRLRRKVRLDAEEQSAAPASDRMSSRSGTFDSSAREISQPSEPAAVAAAPARSSHLKWAYLILLGLLLIGYMFLGRGFAHLGVGPIFIGDSVLLAGLLTAAYAIVRWRMAPPLTWTVGLLIGFAILGAVRTFPYLGAYGLDALRDGVLWGYAAFALIVYVLVDRWSILAGFRTYGWIVPVFALWLPICWNLFRIASLEIDPNRPGSVIPLAFFKAGDMAVHVVGAIAFLVLGMTPVSSVRTFIWRTIICLPLLWTIFVAATSNRGALLTSVVGLAAIVIVAPRSRNWLPFGTAAVIFVGALVLQGLLAGFTGPPGGTGAPVVATSTPSASPPSTPAPTPRPSPRPTSTPALDDEDVDAGPSSSAADAPVVSISNGGFEDPTSGGGVEGWSPRGAELSVLADEAYRGTSFASIANALGPYEATITSSRFSFEGPDLEISAWVKALRAEPTLEIYVNWYSRSGRLISSEFVNQLATEGSRTWRRSSGLIAAPDVASSAAIVFYEASGRSTVGIDEVRVVTGDLIPEAPAPDALSNGDFEDGPADGATIEGWTPSGAVVAIVEGRAHEGERFASVENPLGAYEATLASSRFAFEEGQDIQISLWVTAIDAEPKLEIYVSWFDRSGRQISSVFLNSCVAQGDTTWQTCIGYLPSPPGTTHAQILLYEATGHATIGIDEVVVTAGDFIPEPGPAARPGGRPATIGQMIDNILSLFGSSADGGLEGTKQFRLAWWGTIVDYTLFGEHFWTGKGFGVNLADDDGFQSTSDGSLRAPHNSHLTVLARMGVPGFILWLLVMGAFAIGLLRTTRALRRSGDGRLAAVSAWVLVYWFAMMVDTSFDPYLEGPQGGIWFWSIFGLGLVVMRLDRRARTA